MDGILTEPSFHLSLFHLINCQKYRIESRCASKVTRNFALKSSVEERAYFKRQQTLKMRFRQNGLAIFDPNGVAKISTIKKV